MLIEIFFIGLVVGFIYYEIIGISPGGVIAPAYFALFIHQPQRILVTLFIALVVWIIIRYLSMHLIIYGRRRLLLALLLGFTLKLLLEQGIQGAEFWHLDLQSIGYIIPGLIANEMSRQNILQTLASLGIVMFLTYFIIILVF